MNRLPPEAPKGVRLAILDALKDDEFTIRKPGRRYLEALGFDPNAVAIDVIAYLENEHRVYRLVGQDVRGEKYQCCLQYEHGMVIHVKLIPRGESDGMHVVLDFHRHNTGYPPLPY